MRQLDETPLRALIWRLNALVRMPETERIDRLLDFIAWVRPRLLRPDVKRLYAETTAALLDVRVMQRRGEHPRESGVTRIIRQRAQAEDALEMVTREDSEGVGPMPTPDDKDGGQATC